MKQTDFFVFDTNSLLSAVLIASSVNANALDKAINMGRIVLSKPVIQELKEGIFRKKFDKYLLNIKERFSAIEEIEHNSIFFSPVKTISICRNPKDNKFLELAIVADASCIITGDKDFLILNPFRNIPILNAAAFLNTFFI